jgi:hypothetical protein
MDASASNAPLQQPPIAKLAACFAALHIAVALPGRLRDGVRVPHNCISKLLNCAAETNSMSSWHLALPVQASDALPCAMQVTLVAAFSRVAVMPTRIAAALPTPDSNKPLRPPGAFGVHGWKTPHLTSSPQQNGAFCYLSSCVVAAFGLWHPHLHHGSPPCNDPPAVRTSRSGRSWRRWTATCCCWSTLRSTRRCWRAQVC